MVRIATGSAPISDEVMIFSRAAFGCPIPEGYGQTEATCSITFCHPLDPNLGKYLYFNIPFIKSFKFYVF